MEERIAKAFGVAGLFFTIVIIFPTPTFAVTHISTNTINWQLWGTVISVAVILLFLFVILPALAGGKSKKTAKKEKRSADSHDEHDGSDDGDHPVEDDEEGSHSKSIFSTIWSGLLNTLLFVLLVGIIGYFCWRFILMIPYTETLTGMRGDTVRYNVPYPCTGEVNGSGDEYEMCTSSEPNFVKVGGDNPKHEFNMKNSKWVKVIFPSDEFKAEVTIKPNFTWW